VAPLENPVPASRIATTLPTNEAPISAAPAITTTDAEREAPAHVADSASPQMSFSTHVYADDPTMRAVTLNGRRYVEGDTLSAGVVLKQVTETGVVLDMNGQIIAMDVLQDWR
jgi:general secretion pathway protein B